MKVGIIGGGQLGRMLALSGAPLGMQFTFLDPGEAPCATVAGRHIRAAFDDLPALEALCDENDVVTFEFENISAEALDTLSARELYPPVAALRAAQERKHEKQLFESVGIPVAPWRAINSQADLDQAVADLGLPLIAKTRTLGYDGKGQTRLQQADEATDLFTQMGSVPLLVERLVSFDSELSIIGTRARDGDVVIYPLTRNWHRDGILHRSECTDPGNTLRRQAHRHFQALTEALDYVGTLALECFVCDSLLLGNEFAPRVHNSGHWTQNGTLCSQFENHLRAVTGLPLGHSLHARPAGMLNLIGQLPDQTHVLRQPDCYWHGYDKTGRPGRKIGHINVVSSDQKRVAERLDTLERELGLSR
ncbi:MAG: 5-(carboxyamino)imidazole ribonucleotide synthase [Pseudomonadota bacterium]